MFTGQGHQHHGKIGPLPALREQPEKGNPDTSCGAPSNENGQRKGLGQGWSEGMSIGAAGLCRQCRCRATIGFCVA